MRVPQPFWIFAGLARSIDRGSPCWIREYSWRGQAAPFQKNGGSVRPLSLFCLRGEGSESERHHSEGAVFPGEAQQHGAIKRPQC